MYIDVYTHPLSYWPHKPNPQPKPQAPSPQPKPQPSPKPNLQPKAQNSALTPMPPVHPQALIQY